jgi:hypothetical protein
MLLRRIRVGLVLLVVSCNSGGGDANSVAMPLKDAGPLNCSDAGAGTSFPCDVAPIIQSKCQRCHDQADALSTCAANNSCEPGPFPLRTWSDTRRKFATGRVIDFLPDVIERHIMPLTSANVQPPVEPLTDDEWKKMVAWVQSCAPAATAACP